MTNDIEIINRLDRIEKMLYALSLQQGYDREAMADWYVSKDNHCNHEGQYIDTGGWHCPKCGAFMPTHYPSVAAGEGA